MTSTPDTGKPPAFAPDTPGYEIGYGKPPKSTRFTKGRSGNPKGRPKGSGSLANRLQRMLDETITVHQNGEPRRIRKGDAILQQLIVKAVRGDTASARMILTQLADPNAGERVEQTAVAARSTDIYSLSDDELMAIINDALPPGHKGRMEAGND